ncbi:Colicin V production protein [hydrothermal vent metagenome]|uniref:Colicin V production protein n=1 Tax=hydrothermal vent metagenome TaxID=652676 RepID=A0A1W1D592_9ZZZZ
MDLNYFDIIVVAIVLFLGLKGIMNGFFKELFGLVGIIGGIFIASRYGDEVGQYLSDFIFKFENQSAINFTGFLVTLVTFWVAMIIAGKIFTKLSSMSGLSPVDRMLGFVIGAGKFFLISAVIAYALNNVNAFHKILEDKTKGSAVFPILLEVGGMVMKLDAKEFEGTIHKKVDGVMQSSASEITEGIKKEIVDAMPQSAQEMAEEGH